jgi:hypothetical protein
MLGDAWPAATDTRLTTQRTALAEAAANYESGKVVYVQIPKVSPGGCSSHPNVENNISTAAVIETAIREATGW